MEKEYQHFVPKFYLRNFSNDSKSVGSYIFSKRKLIANASIEKICGRKFLYGEDLHVEDWFMALEGKWANIIRQIISTGKLCLDYNSWAYILMFIYLSDVRTGYHADLFSNFQTTLAQTMVKLAREHKELDVTDSEIERLRVTIDKPNLISIQNMAEVTEIMSDLTPLLIRNTTNRQFITSDCPMAKYNQLFISRNYHRNCGYGHVGAQCFIPISPYLCLVLIDSAVYDYKCDDNRVITINAPDQIIELNKLFLHNSDRSIYFNNSERPWVIERLACQKKDNQKDSDNEVFGNAVSGYLNMLSFKSVQNNIKLPAFFIRPQYKIMPFPQNTAGPFRPFVERIVERKKKSEDSAIM